jgi:hypothetical protein
VVVGLVGLLEILVDVDVIEVDVVLVVVDTLGIVDRKRGWRPRLVDVVVAVLLLHGTVVVVVDQGTW